jgi:hypothetical protein
MSYNLISSTNISYYFLVLTWMIKKKITLVVKYYYSDDMDE